MTRRVVVLLTALGLAGVCVAVEACATSAVGEVTDGGGATNDAGSQGIDGSPLQGDGGNTDGGVLNDSGSCVLTPPSNKCGVYPQCGCNGTTCDFEITTGFPTDCADAAGTLEGGSACTITADCAPGLTCLRERCHAYCGAAGTTCAGAEYSQCYQLTGSGGPIEHFLVCGIQCDLVNAASCGGGKVGCVPVAIGADHTSDCQPVGDGGTGAPCTSPLDCSPGYDCVNNGSSTVCAPYCNVSVGTCPGGTGTCTGFSPALTIDGTEYGICQ